MRTYRIRVYAGVEVDKDGNIIHSADSRDGVHTIAEHASRQYGGVTAYFHRGSWMDGGNVVSEHGATFELLTSSDVGREFAAFVRDTFRQKSVVLTVEEVDVYFV